MFPERERILLKLHRGQFESELAGGEHSIPLFCDSSNNGDIESISSSV
jgi:hypothetical protein